VSRYATEDAYVIDVPLKGRQAEDIDVDTRGNWILLRIDRSLQETREDTFDEGRGYARTYRFSSGMASRRFIAPRDADLGAISREEVGGSLRILIPRR
jgi:HSP20 family molecular chaperone IbpA